MSNDSNFEEFYELMVTYLTGNASDAEVLQLEGWVTEKPEHKELFIKVKRAWMLSGIAEGKVAVDLDKEWEKLVPTTLRNNELAIESKDGKVAETDGKVVRLGKEKTEKSGTKYGWWRIAAAIIVLVGASILLFNQGNHGRMEVLASTEMKEQGLPDGSQVALNQFSTLTYIGEEENRSVALQGDAFFEVARDTEHPFVIKAASVEIEVLGTSFYVDARAEIDQIQVMVISGSVAVRDGSTSIVLKANESGVYDKRKKELTKGVIDNNNYLAWKTKELNFEDTFLPEVVFALNRQYHAQISIDNPVLNACQLTATYKQKSLDAVLTIIAQSLGLEVKRSGEQIILTGTGC